MKCTREARRILVHQGLHKVSHTRLSVRLVPGCRGPWVGYIRRGRAGKGKTFPGFGFSGCRYSFFSVLVVLMCRPYLSWPSCIVIIGLEFHLRASETGLSFLCTIPRAIPSMRLVVSTLCCRSAAILAHFACEFVREGFARHAHSEPLNCTVAC